MAKEPLKKRKSKHSPSDEDEQPQEKRVDKMVDPMEQDSDADASSVCSFDDAQSADSISYTSENIHMRYAVAAILRHIADKPIQAGVQLLGSRFDKTVTVDLSSLSDDDEKDLMTARFTHLPPTYVEVLKSGPMREQLCHFYSEYQMSFLNLRPNPIELPPIDLSPSGRRGLDITSHSTGRPVTHDQLQLFGFFARRVLPKHIHLVMPSLGFVFNQERKTWSQTMPPPPPPPPAPLTSTAPPSTSPAPTVATTTSAPASTITASGLQPTSATVTGTSSSSAATNTTNATNTTPTVLPMTSPAAAPPAIPPQLARSEEAVKQHAKSFAAAAAARDPGGADVDVDDETPLVVQRSCVADIRGIRLAFNWTRVVMDFYKEYPTLKKRLRGYALRNDGKTLEFTFDAPEAMVELLQRGLNTHRLHLVFTADIPGLVSVSVPFLPTELPMAHLTKVLAKHGVVHDSFLCKKKIDDEMVTTGNRVVKMVMDPLDPVPPIISVRGHTSITIYTGMWEFFVYDEYRRDVPPRGHNNSGSRNDNNNSKRSETNGQDNQNDTTRRTNNQRQSSDNTNSTDNNNIPRTKDRGTKDRGGNSRDRSRSVGGRSRSALSTSGRGRRRHRRRPKPAGAEAAAYMALRCTAVKMLVSDDNQQVRRSVRAPLHPETSEAEERKMDKEQTELFNWCSLIAEAEAVKQLDVYQSEDPVDVDKAHTHKIKGGKEFNCLTSNVSPRLAAYLLESDHTCTLDIFSDAGAVALLRGFLGLVNFGPLSALDPTSVHDVYDDNARTQWALLEDEGSVAKAAVILDTQIGPRLAHCYIDHPVPDFESSLA